MILRGSALQRGVTEMDVVHFIQSGPFTKLYHGEYLSISNTDIKIRVSSGDLCFLVMY